MVCKTVYYSSLPTYSFYFAFYEQQFLLHCIYYIYCISYDSHNSAFAYFFLRISVFFFFFFFFFYDLTFLHHIFCLLSILFILLFTNNRNFSFFLNYQYIIYVIFHTTLMILFLCIYFYVFPFFVFLLFFIILCFFTMFSASGQYSSWGFSLLKKKKAYCAQNITNYVHWSFPLVCILRDMLFWAVSRDHSQRDHYHVLALFGVLGLWKWCAKQCVQQHVLTKKYKSLKNKYNIRKKQLIKIVERDIVWWFRCFTIWFLSMLHTMFT